MSDNEEWSEWHLHDGRGQPVPNGTWVEFEDRAGEVEQCFAEEQSENGAMADCWTWCETGDWFLLDIMRYRIRKPRGLVILEQIAQGIKQPEDA